MTVHVGFVLDMSGSMMEIKEATKEGVGAYLKELRVSSPEARLHLTAFDTVFEKWVVDERVSDVDVDALVARYQPRAGTALVDAFGITINDLKKAAKEKVAPGEPFTNRVVCVVMTDGKENSSRKYTTEQVHDMVVKLTKKGNWTFVFLGANVDAWSEASKLGIAAGNTMAFSSSEGSTQSAFLANARATGQRLNSPMASTTSFYEDAGEEQDIRDENDRSSSPPPKTKARRT